MATRVTSLERARMVLAIFHLFRCRPGDVLVLGNLIVTGAKHGLEAWEIDVGLDIGREHGWFEFSPDHMIRLTKTGCDAICANAGVVHGMPQHLPKSYSLTWNQ